jgi:hypothetical protein
VSIDVLAETIQTLDVRRAELRGELAALDEAITLLRKVRIQPVSVPTKEKPAPVVLPPADFKRVMASAGVCARSGCGNVIPPMPPHGGRPRIYRSKSCNKKATRLRALAAATPAPPVDDEDPTDRAIRMHKELHPVPESASGMRSRRAR